MIHVRTTCRACGSDSLELILDLGVTALANDFLTLEEALQPQAAFPLRLNLCTHCSLVQLAEVVDPGVLYSRYAYVTSTSKTMDAHLRSQCEHLLRECGKPRPRVVEIASNTGVYLKHYQARGCEVLGVEPARNIAEVAESAGVPTWADFFNAHNARQVRDEWGAADLILGRHVFAHIDDWRDLVAGLDALLADEGLVALEVPYLGDFLEHTEYDTIYHEHLSYVSVTSVAALLKGTSLRLQRVDAAPIHGGSVLLQLRRASFADAAHASVDTFLARERALRFADPATWRPFADRVARIRRELPGLVRGLKAQGKHVIGYGASAKGNTLLNTCGLTPAELDCIIDNTPFKQNKRAPGSQIPVRPPEALLQTQPDYALLLAWNFADEIIGREEEYQKRGGRFILPIPEPKIVPFNETLK